MLLAQLHHAAASSESSAAVAGWHHSLLAGVTCILALAVTALNGQIKQMRATFSQKSYEEQKCTNSTTAELVQAVIDITRV